MSHGGKADLSMRWSKRERALLYDGSGPAGLPFAPSWQILRPMLVLRRSGDAYDEDAAWPGYVDAYTAEMRVSYRANRPAWDALLARDEVTLVCYCRDQAHCHRTVLAEILGRRGADVRGERPIDKTKTTATKRTDDNE